MVRGSIDAEAGDIPRFRKKKFKKLCLNSILIHIINSKEMLSPVYVLMALYFLFPEIMLLIRGAKASREVGLSAHSRWRFA
jgi:hypothetical protein